MMDESQYGSGPIAPNTPCFGDRAASRRLRGSDTQLPVALVRGEVVRLLHRQGPRRAGAGLRLRRSRCGARRLTYDEARRITAQHPAACSSPARAFGGEGLSAKLTGGGEPEDQRIESFLGDVLALAGEEPDAVREGVRVTLAKCEAIFRLQEPKRRMRDQAAHACRALCRARVADELRRRRGTR
jgi:hypothetical protein